MTIDEKLASILIKLDAVDEKLASILIRLDDLEKLNAIEGTENITAVKKVIKSSDFTITKRGDNNEGIFLTKDTKRIILKEKKCCVVCGKSHDVLSTCKVAPLAIKGLSAEDIIKSAEVFCKECMKMFNKLNNQKYSLKTEKSSRSTIVKLQELL